MTHYTFNDEDQKLYVWLDDILIMEFTYEFLKDQING